MKKRIQIHRYQPHQKQTLLQSRVRKESAQHLLLLVLKFPVKNVSLITVKKGECDLIFLYLLESVVADIAHTPTSGISTTAVEPQQSNMMPANVITIDDDTDDVQPSWKQSNSMKIEALISGPSTEKKN